MPSFQGIQTDCDIILSKIKDDLKKQFSNPDATAKDLAEAVDLLLQLREPAQELCTSFLQCAEKRLGALLVMLRDQSEQRDIIEFIDLGCSGFLSDLCLVVASFNDMFVNRSSVELSEYSEVSFFFVNIIITFFIAYIFYIL